MKIKVLGTAKDKKRVLVFLGIIFAFAAIFSLLGAISFPMKTVHYEIRSDKVTKPFRIVQISDLHAEDYGKDMERLTSLIDEAHPDLIALTGDIYDDKLDNTTTTTLMKYIAPRYTCVYVAGNHEFYDPSRWAANKDEAVSLGIQVLEGEIVQVGEVTVCGAARAVSIGELKKPYDWDDAVIQCADSLDTDGFAVLLAHFPHKIDFYRSFGKFDLIMCGHAHGGQWRLPWTQNGLFAPDQGIFPKLSGGRFDYDDTTMIVSRGLTRTKNIIPRIFNNPELVITDIIPE